MNFTKETLELIQTTAVAAAGAKLFSSSADGRKSHFMLGGEHVVIEEPPEPRKHTVGSLADLLKYARLGWIEGPDRPSFWFSEAGVVLVLDNHDRRDTVTFPLVKSEAYKALLELAANSPWMTQPEMIRYLKIKLGIRDESVLGKFRRLDWSHSTEGKASIDRGRESISQSVQREIQQIADFPETLYVDLPLFTNRGEDAIYAVKCYVELDVVNVRIQIAPLSGELEHVLHAHLETVRTRLEEGVAGALDTGEVGFAVYFGTPS